MQSITYAIIAFVCLYIWNEERLNNARNSEENRIKPTAAKVGIALFTLVWFFAGITFPILAII